jgi:hypothetical protein
MLMGLCIVCDARWALCNNLQVLIATGVRAQHAAHLVAFCLSLLAATAASVTAAHVHAF